MRESKRGDSRRRGKPVGVEPQVFAPIGMAPGMSVPINRADDGPAPERHEQPTGEATWLESSEYLPLATSTSPDQGLAQSGHHPRYRHRFAACRPLFPVHPDKELSWPERDAQAQDLEVFASTIILDRNSQVGFHKSMLAKGAMKTNRAHWCARTGA